MPRHALCARLASKHGIPMFPIDPHQLCVESHERRPTSIHERAQVHDRQDGEDPHVDLAPELLLLFRRKNRRCRILDCFLQVFIRSVNVLYRIDVDLFPFCTLVMAPACRHRSGSAEERRCLRTELEHPLLVYSEKPYNVPHSMMDSISKSPQLTCRTIRAPTAGPRCPR